MVKIDKKLFNSLKQLDRIEFRQKREIIEEKLQSNFTGLIVIFWLFSFIVGSLFIGLSWGGEMMIQYMQSFKSNLGMVAITFFVGLLGDVLILSKKRDALADLESEFFEVKLKESNNGKRKR